MSPQRADYRAGVAASLAAEAVFVGMVAATSLLRGTDPWRVVRMPASFLIGPAAIEPPGFVPREVAAGLAIHVLLAIVVGIVFAALLPRSGLTPVAGGIVTGGVLYALGFWALPLLFPAWLAPFWLPPAGRALQAIAHLVYGVAFELAYRRLAR